MMRRVCWGLAALIAAGFLLLHVAGARDAVSLLSGTPTADPVVGVGGGVLYVISWFGLTIVAPILVLAGGLSSWLRPAREGSASTPRGFGGKRDVAATR